VKVPYWQINVAKVFFGVAIENSESR
jgi:hypothetical protein